MLLIICPKCRSDLVEEGKNGRIDCLKCADEFELVDAKYKYTKLSEIEGAPKIDPPKAKKFKQKTIDQTKYSEFRQYYNKLKGEQK
jgi:uncharacterized Zn finger protein (UPF0148 family)